MSALRGAAALRWSWCGRRRLLSLARLNLPCVFLWLFTPLPPAPAPHRSYVGGAPGKIDLYVGKEVVRRGIDNDSACDQLIELIKVRGAGGGGGGGSGGGGR